MKELQKNVLEDQQEKMKLKEKIKAMIKLTYKWNENLESSQKEIEVLRSKVRYAEMKSQQLRRMASENASTASKWRAKAMESLEAQKELEEKKNAAEKAALEFYVDENSKLVKVFLLLLIHSNRNIKAGFFSKSVFFFQWISKVCSKHW